MGTFVPPPPPRPIEQPNSMEQLGQLMALRNQMQMQPLQMQAMQQENQLRSAQVQLAQQDLAARQALNKAYAGAMTKDENGNPTFDSDKLMQGLANGPAAYQSPQVMKGITDFQKSRIDLQTSLTDLQQKSADMIGNAANAVKAANYDPTLAHSLLDSLPQSPQLNAIRAQIDNPQALRQMVDTAIANSASQQKLQNAKDVAQIRANTPEMQGMKAWLDQQNQGLQPGTPGWKTPFDYQQQKINMQTQADVARETNPAVIRAKEQVAGYEAQMRQALSQGDPNAAAQLLVNGDATLSELKARGSTPDFITKTLAAAHQLSGGQYNPQEAEAQFDIAKSPANTTFFGSAKSLIAKGGTLDQLAAAGKDLPGGKFPAFNSIADWERAATGSGPIAKYAATALGVADDYAKVMGGGQGSDTSRLQALNLIGAKQSPDQRTAAIDGIRNAVNSQAVERIGKNKVMQRMYGEGLQMPGAAGATVRLRAPNGQIKEVPADQMQHYLSLGAKQVQ